MVNQKKEFTKEDLKSGMVVEYQDGNRRLVVGDMLIGENGCSNLSGFSLELQHEIGKMSIMKVYKIEHAGTFRKFLDDNNLDLIWERTESKTMTVEEMRKKLEELTGEKIEVEPDKKEPEIDMIKELRAYCEDADGCRNCIFQDQSCVFNIMTDAELKKSHEKLKQYRESEK